MPFSLRKARVDDAPGIARVHVDSWRTTYRDLLKAETLASLSYERRAEWWERLLADPESTTLLYTAEDENGRIVGFVAAGPCQESDQDADGEIHAIYLLKEVQGKGLGRQLMQAAMDELTRRGFRSILLWVLKDNLPSRGFYEAMGGAFLKEKPITIGDQTLMEVAYIWEKGTVQPGGKALPEA